MDLSDLDFSELDFSEVDFSGGDFPGRSPLVFYSVGPRLFREPAGIVRGENWSHQAFEAFRLFVRQIAGAAGRPKNMTVG
jgi:hypothetical protein